MTITEHVQAIQSASDNLNAEREAAADLGGDMQHFAATGFWTAWESLLLVVLRAVRAAETARAGAFMRRLLPVLNGSTRCVQIRRMMESDRINSSVSHFYRFLSALDSLMPAIRTLGDEPRHELIQSIREMEKAGCPLPMIRRQWEDREGQRTGLAFADIEEIRTGLRDDIRGDQHPAIVAWKAENDSMPAFDDGLLAGECRTIERTRERAAAVA
jgi:hypothetical protein